MLKYDCRVHTQNEKYVITHSYLKTIFRFIKIFSYVLKCNKGCVLYTENHLLCNIILY